MNPLRTQRIITSGDMSEDTWCNPSKMEFCVCICTTLSRPWELWYLYSLMICSWFFFQCISLLLDVYSENMFQCKLSHLIKWNHICNLSRKSWKTEGISLENLDAFFVDVNKRIDNIIYKIMSLWTWFWVSNYFQLIRL